MNQPIRCRLSGRVLPALLILLTALVAPLLTPTLVDAARRSAKPPTPVVRLTCPEATTLEELVTCIIGQGPYVSGTDYVEPSTAV